MSPWTPWTIAEIIASHASRNGSVTSSSWGGRPLTGSFDCIAALDCLEHTVDPMRIARELTANQPWKTTLPGPVTYSVKRGEDETEIRGDGGGE